LSSVPGQETGKHSKPKYFRSSTAIFKWHLPVLRGSAYTHTRASPSWSQYFMGACRVIIHLLVSLLHSLPCPQPTRTKQRARAKAMLLPTPLLTFKVSHRQIRQLVKTDLQISCKGEVLQFPELGRRLQHSSEPARGSPASNT